MLPTAGVLAVVVPLYATLIVAYGFSPLTTDVGYQPPQPVPFSHAVHAGQLGIDCRYCHNTVEYAARAAIPPTQTCMNCHTQIHKDSPKLDPLWASYKEGTPVEWIRVHDLPDFAYFNHAAHVTRGVSCVECHGRIDKMEVVYQQETLSMGWCLSCHRHPDVHLRDPSLVTQLWWEPEGGDEQRLEIGTEQRQRNDLSPSQDCSACHR
ncbi:MAG: cytochrome c3 family protein [Planctomycetota bacterium]